MATQSFTSRMRHDSDATFREWGLELSNALQAVGCVKTADTGQIDWATVARPGANTDGGYEIRYMNDSLHGTTPCYIKIYYGTGPAATTARLRIEVGEGSDGSGTLTGSTLSVQTVSTSGSMATNLDVTYPSYVSMARGVLAVNCKIGRTGSTYAAMGFMVMRPLNTDGSLGASGYRVILHNGSTTANSNAKCADYYVVGGSGSWSALRTTGNMGGISFDRSTSGASFTNSSGDNEMGLVHIYLDRTRPCYLGFCGTTGATAYTTFTTNPVGVTSITYLIVESCLGYCWGFSTQIVTNAMYTCIPWE